MSLTLGEKLRQAREERGFTVAEVAEQTRISSLYLQSIENDDYKILPGGIFNKGFVKSYAKFVGINEQEALLEYSQLIAGSENGPDDLKVYKPEVLTDDRSSGSMIPTVLVATLILGLMTAGILYGVSYLRAPSEPSGANTNQTTNSNSQAEMLSNTSSEPAPVPGDVPDMATLKVEFKSLNAAVSLAVNSDGKMTSSTVSAGSSVIFEPKENLKLSYSKSLANAVQLTINGKPIALPAQPLVPKRNAIEFEINKDNLVQIWTSGAISNEVAPAVPDANANTGTIPPNSANQAVSVATPVRTVPTPKPAVTANTNSAKTSVPKPANTAKPPVMSAKPSNTTQ